MGNLLKYLTIMSGLILLFHFSGLLAECDGDGLCTDKTPNSKLLGILLNFSSMNLSDIFTLAFDALNLVVATGIIIGGLAIAGVELTITRAFAIFLFTLGWDIFYAFNKVFSVNPVIAILLFGPIGLFFIVVLIEWWRGVST